MYINRFQYARWSPTAKPDVSIGFHDGAGTFLSIPLSEGQIEQVEILLKSFLPQSAQSAIERLEDMRVDALMIGDSREGSAE